MKYDNCKDCHSLCEHAGRDREFICIDGISCKIPEILKIPKGNIDLVAVVRCKDCKWFYRDEEFNRAWCGYNKCGANEVAVNGYCYRGERKDNERKAD